MSFQDGSDNRNLNSSKNPARPSHEAVVSQTGDADDVTKTEEQHLDRAAMESATRAQNRIHADEQNIPGSTLFTK